MKPEMRKKKPTKTKPLLKMGAKISMCGGVKWKKTMLSASRVRRPVRAVNGGLRTIAGAAVATAGVNGNSSLSYHDDRRDGKNGRLKTAGVARIRCGSDGSHSGIWLKIDRLLESDDSSSREL